MNSYRLFDKANIAEANTLSSSNKLGCVLKVLFCVLFILIIEIGLGLYMYQSTSNQFNAIQRDYMLKEDFRQFLLDSFDTEDVMKFFLSVQHRAKRSKDVSSTTIYPFYVRHPPPAGPPGPVGPPGLPGPQGPKGESGDLGKPGQKGEYGLNGTPGVRGQKGEMGISARPGEKGEKGEAGFQGPKGIDGEYGVPGLGIPGDKGEPGEKGRSGIGKPGSIGLPGLTGLTGPKGEEGTPGFDGLKGEKGDVGAQGLEGIKGPQGPEGQKGQKGEEGKTGPTGLQGEKGELGPKGDDGLKGDVGLPGPKGDTGVKGDEGKTLMPGLHCWEKDASYSCSCPPGYEYSKTDKSCVDIDECLKYSPCDPLSKCSNVDPGYECGPCPSGYLRNLTSYYFWQYLPLEGHQCPDIDECATNTDNCPVDAACKNLPGSFKCIQCDKNAQIVKNTVNMERCECQVGWAGDGTVCGIDSDIDGWPDVDLTCTGKYCKRDNCLNTPNSGQEDADGDGIGDSCDNDSDNDGVLDTSDNCPLISNSDQKDRDGDKIGDVCDNCPNQINKGQQDLDKDGLGNECDPDSDGDNVENAKDNCPIKANPDQMDTDKDGIGDVCDNCPNAYNPDQEDFDENLIGDACDGGSDIDGDGIIDTLDNCKEIPNTEQTDSDQDGMGDACDLDIDNDGLLNFYDNCVFIPNPDQKDSNGDGRGDKCQDDNDGDGVNDEFDNCPNNSLIHKTDFSYFQTVKLDPYGTSQVDPNWIILNYGAEITQTENSDPGLAVDFNKIGGLDYEGTFFVEGNDDDHAGFIFSYQSNRRFYIITWKQGYQQYWENSPFKAYGEPGVQIKLVNSATGPGVTLRNALWHAGTTPNEVTLLYHDPKKEGWVRKKSYRWKLIHRPKIGLIRLRMYDGPKLITDSGNIFDKTLTGGRVGVYCFSQDNIIWANVQYNCNDYIPKDIYDELPPETQKLVIRAS